MVGSRGRYVPAPGCWQPAPLRCRSGRRRPTGSRRRCSRRSRPSWSVPLARALRRDPQHLGNLGPGGTARTAGVHLALDRPLDVSSASTKSIEPSKCVLASVGRSLGSDRRLRGAARALRRLSRARTCTPSLRSTPLDGRARIRLSACSLASPSTTNHLVSVPIHATSVARIQLKLYGSGL